MSNQSNRKHRSEAYLQERRNEHSGVEEEACRGDRKFIAPSCCIFSSYIAR